MGHPNFDTDVDMDTSCFGTNNIACLGVEMVNLVKLKLAMVCNYNLNYQSHYNLIEIY